MKPILLALLASLTLGLAPFSPPHIWKQFQNISLGREMLLMDWVDVLMHGAPWAALIFLGVLELKKLRQKKSQP
jgi:hypothetical protein